MLPSLGRVRVKFDDEEECLYADIVGRSGSLFLFARKTSGTYRIAALDGNAIHPDDREAASELAENSMTMNKIGRPRGVRLPKSEELAKLGETIKKARIGRGYTLDLLSDESGIPASTLSDLEIGRVDPKVTVLRRLIGILELDWEELF